MRVWKVGNAANRQEGERQLQEFFRREHQEFELPLDAAGTPFQVKVWEALRQIPYGETRSYKDIAIAFENPKGVRAIGMANNRNPIAITTPLPPRHRHERETGGLCRRVASEGIFAES